MKDVEKEYRLQLLCLQQEITIWQDAYLVQHTANKTDVQLLREGWLRGFGGSWHSKRMDTARNRKFGKKMEELGHFRLMSLQKSPNLIELALSKASARCVQKTRSLNSKR